MCEKRFCDYNAVLDWCDTADVRRIRIVHFSPYAAWYKGKRERERERNKKHVKYYIELYFAFFIVIFSVIFCVLFRFFFCFFRYSAYAIYFLVYMFSYCRFVCVIFVTFVSLYIYMWLFNSYISLILEGFQWIIMELGLLLCFILLFKISCYMCDVMPSIIITYQ